MTFSQWFGIWASCLIAGVVLYSQWIIWKEKRYISSLNKHNMQKSETVQVKVSRLDKGYILENEGKKYGLGDGNVLRETIKFLLDGVSGNRMVKHGGTISIKVEWEEPAMGDQVGASPMVSGPKLKSPPYKGRQVEDEDDDE